MRLTDEQLRGIFLGGLLAGVVSAIPLLNLGNCFCCLWAWVSGGAAVALIRRQEALPDRDLPKVGLLAGAYAGLVATVLELVWNIFFGLPAIDRLAEIRRMMPSQMPPETTRLFEQLFTSGTMGLASALTRIFLFALFGALGAVVYGRLVRPKSDASPPRPAPDGPADPR